MAGHETTSVGLTWAFEALSKHPEVEQKLAEEINKHFSSKDLTAINPEEIDQVVSQIRRRYLSSIANQRTILALFEQLYERNVAFLRTSTSYYSQICQRGHVARKVQDPRSCKSST